jgi:hypothetical protein
MPCRDADIYVDLPGFFHDLHRSDDVTLRLDPKCLARHELAGFLSWRTHSSRPLSVRTKKQRAAYVWHKQCQFAPRCTLYGISLSWPYGNSNQCISWLLYFFFFLLVQAHLWRLQQVLLLTTEGHAFFSHQIKPPCHAMFSCNYHPRHKMLLLSPQNENLQTKKKHDIGVLFFVHSWWTRNQHCLLRTEAICNQVSSAHSHRSDAQPQYMHACILRSFAVYIHVHHTFSSHIQEAQPGSNIPWRFTRMLVINFYPFYHVFFNWYTK